jgi:hypothetical protein
VPPKLCSRSPTDFLFLFIFLVLCGRIYHTPESDRTSLKCRRTSSPMDRRSSSSTIS